MIMVRELSDEEILNAAYNEWLIELGSDGVYRSSMVEGSNAKNAMLQFARALFEAARVQQTER